MSGILTGIGCFVVATLGGLALGYVLHLIGLQPKPLNTSGAFFTGYMTCMLIGHYVYRLRPQTAESSDE